MNRFFSILWACLVIGSAGMSLAAGQGSIVAESSATVDGEEIRLADLARVDAPEFARQMLEDISLGRSPKPGKVKTISKRQVLSSLRSSQDLVQDFVLEIPDRIYVRRSSQAVPGKEVRSFVEEMLSRQFRDKEVTLTQLDLPDSGDYAVGRISLAPADALRIGSDGKFSLGLEVFVDGQKEDRLRVTGRAEVYDTLAVAGQRLSQGQPLSAADMTLVRMNIFSQKGEGIHNPAAVTGKTLSRDVAKGEFILAEWLKPVPLVRKGEVVMLVARKGSIMIQTSGVSKEDGFMDDLIQVENIGSGKVIRGQVKKASFVEVVF